jgi:hypothetical protein
MIEFDPYRDKFVPPSLAASRANLSEREFRAHKRPGSRLPVYRLPSVTPRGAPIERYLEADLRLLAEGVLF